MGLDMYLYKRRFIWHDEQSMLMVAGIPGIDSSKIKEIKQEELYWRKANAIHRWFVLNVQDGKDDCGTYLVALSDLQALFKLVQEVLDAGIGTENANIKVAEQLLPAQQGFFFGDTEYDSYYREQLEYTAKNLKELIDNHDSKFEYEYHSSW